MQLIRFLPILLLIASISGAQPLEQKSPTQVMTQFSRLYIPEGFDDNDNIQILGAGMYPTTCYRNAETTVSVDEAQKRIQLNPTALYYSGICLQVLLPFERVLDLGLLKAGTYSIFQNDNPNSIGQINVRHALNSEPDDESYAPVSQVFVQSKNAKTQVLITGEMPTSCMKLKEIRVDVQNDVIVLLPIIEMKSQPCTPGKYAFESAKDLNVKPGRYLIHVRSMNGKSINNLVEIP